MDVPELRDHQRLAEWKGGAAMRPTNGLRDLRLAAGLTGVECARRAGIVQSYLSELETGRRNLTLAMAARLAPVLGAEVDQLIAASGVPAGSNAPLLATVLRELEAERAEHLAEAEWHAERGLREAAAIYRAYGAAIEKVILRVRLLEGKEAAHA